MKSDSRAGRLKQLARIRKVQEAAQARRLASAEQSLSQAEAELDAQRQQLDGMGPGEAKREMSAGEMAMLAAWSDDLGRKIDQQAGVVAERNGAVQETLGDVKRAWQERRIVETVRDRAAIEEAATEQAAELRRNDDVALTAHARRGKELGATE